MKFKYIEIKNFRNFEDIKINLNNKNVLFGLNDIGKTNFLYALRFIFDKDIRKQNMLDSDFFQLNINRQIKITICLDIDDENEEDNKKLRAKLRGSVGSNHTSVYIQLKCTFNKQESIGIPELFWGGDIKHLEKMHCKGIYYDVDYVFNLIYIDAYVDLFSLFKKNSTKLLKNNKEKDKDVLNSIHENLTDLNSNISKLSGVNEFENKITPKYKKFGNKDVSISIKSEIAVKGLYSNIIPYIKQDEDDSLYPTSGEGRKKMLVYSIIDLLSEEESKKKINLFLIEEPENHLHKSMQIALSKLLFTDEKYKYLFITTHSQYVLSEIENVNLIRIYNENKITSKSQFYSIPKDFSNVKKILNRGLVEAIFYDKVLLVEGPSELFLFEKVLSETHPDYEINGGYILYVRGVGFKPYINILKPLGIKCAIKTDNDLRKQKTSELYSVLGFIRINQYISKSKLPKKPIEAKDAFDVDAKRTLYANNKDLLDLARDRDGVYLSYVSLEEDLYEVLPEKLDEYLPESKNEGAIKFLQSKKGENMVKLSGKLTHEDCELIYNSYAFQCLREVVE